VRAASARTEQGEVYLISLVQGATDTSLEERISLLLSTT
jgi:hypothetical protein